MAAKSKPISKIKPTKTRTDLILINPSTRTNRIPFYTQSKCGCWNRYTWLYGYYSRGDVIYPPRHKKGHNT